MNFMMRMSMIRMSMITMNDNNWNIGTLEHSTFNQHLVISIALILFKRLRVTLVTSIASRD